MIIRANADTVEEAQAARDLGIRGVGLCRSESMLLGGGQIDLMRAIAGAPDTRIRNEAIALLLPLHQASLESILQAMSPHPVFIRLLDPPLQDFLPTLQQIDIGLSDARSDENWDEVIALRHMRHQHAALGAANPTLGHRGCRLSLTHPEILSMQVTAILQAGLALQEAGIETGLNILIPLVASEEETRVLAGAIRGVASEVFGRSKREIAFRLGPLIELPRAAICAGAISQHVDFVCFGTNDLTQTTYGFSKEDTKAYLDSYLQQGIFQQDPFLTLDRDGVGYLLTKAITDIHCTQPNMEIGVCGDHCRDADSLRFLHSLGVNFISCASSCLVNVTRTLEQLLEKQS